MNAFANASRTGVIVLSAAVCTSHAAGAAATTARTRTLDIRHVAIDLRFDWQARQAIGNSTITLSLRRATDTVNLQWRAGRYEKQLADNLGSR